jgi:molecular chaperone Hsp33
MYDPNPTHDTMQRFLFEDAPIRGEIVRLDATWRAVLDRRDYPPALRDVLGEFMAAAALLVTTLKFNGRLIMQAQGDGPVKLLVVECTSERAMRGLAHWEGDVQSGTLAEMLGRGKVAITIDPEGSKERYQGIVSLEGNTVAEALEHYFATSEQLDTRLWLAADGAQAAGMLLQKLPREAEVDFDAWGRAVHLGSTVTRDELLHLPAREIIHRLYHEEDIRLFSGTPVSFRCSCSRERVEAVLRMLGHNEVRSIIDERGAIDVDCEFCGSHYRLDAVDAEQLFAAAHMTDASPTHH